MIRCTKEQLLSIYGMLIKRTGGSTGVLNESLIDSALNNIWQTFDGLELYPTLVEKAARLGYSLVSNHSFRDGNKRIGLLAMLTFLAVACIMTSSTDFGFKTTARGAIPQSDIIVFPIKHSDKGETISLHETF